MRKSNKEKSACFGAINKLTLVTNYRLDFIQAHLSISSLLLLAWYKPFCVSDKEKAQSTTD